MKIVKKENGDFIFRKEPHYDEGVSGLENFICALCNSAELDFIAEDEALKGLPMYRLYNLNTGKGYCISDADAQVYDNCDEIQIDGFDPDDSFKDLFKSFFNETCPA